MNIYEVNIGSWKMKKDFTAEEDGEFYSYEEMIELLIPYLVENNYTHLELMPLTEFRLMVRGGIKQLGILV